MDTQQQQQQQTNSNGNKRKTPPSNLDLDSSNNDPPPDLHITSDNKPDAQIDSHEEVDLELMDKSDREIEESIVRIRKNFNLIRIKLPDGGQKFKANLRRHEFELERRKKLQLDKVWVSLYPYMLLHCFYML